MQNFDRYFHKTDRFDFKPGYKNRRINLTLLFGKAQNTPTTNSSAAKQAAQAIKCSDVGKALKPGGDGDQTAATCESCQKAGMGWCYSSKAYSHCTSGFCAANVMGACRCGPDAHWIHPVAYEEDAELRALVKQFKLPVGCPKRDVTKEMITGSVTATDEGHPVEASRMRDDRQKKKDAVEPDPDAVKDEL